MILPGGRGRIAGVDFNPDGPSRLRLTIDVDDNAVEMADSIVPNYALVAACVWQRGDHGGLRVLVDNLSAPISLTLKSGATLMRVPSTQILRAEMEIAGSGDATMTLDVPIESRHGRRAVELINRSLEVRVSSGSDAAEIVDDGDSLAESGRMTARDMKSIRKSLGLSRDEMAKILDLSRKTVQRYECGERRIPQDLGEKIRSLRDLASREAQHGGDP